VVENLAQRGAYTQHRAGAFGGIADQIRKLLGRK
jgi:uridine phosphorylase